MERHDPEGENRQIVKKKKKSVARDEYCSIAGWFRNTHSPLQRSTTQRVKHTLSHTLYVEND